MLILVRTIGQRSNQIWQHIAYESYCKENKTHFINLELSRLQKYYPKLRKNYFFYSFIAPMLAFFLKLCNKLRLLKILDLDRQSDLERFYKIKQNRLVFAKGFTFSPANAIDNNRDLYNSQFLFKTENILSNLFENTVHAYITLGIHIRRGDYKDFQGGKYYYTDDEYIHIIQKMLNVLSDKAKVLIFTNDSSIDKNKYVSQFSACAFSSNTIEIDHSLMANCDYLIGPPSTFTMLASYLGNTPLYLIESTTDNFTLEDFKIYNHV